MSGVAPPLAACRCVLARRGRVARASASAGYPRVGSSMINDGPPDRTRRAWAETQTECGVVNICALFFIDIVLSSRLGLGPPQPQALSAVSASASLSHHSRLTPLT